MRSNPMTFTRLAPSEGWRHFLRQPLTWVLAWAVWSLLALSWFGYQDALAGVVCRTS